MKAKVYAFGPFELDPPQQQLRRRGIRLRLPVSRLRLLLLFVTRSGDLVTREEIAACLWKNSETVDIVGGINTAMKQLRAQLGDDSASPKYIETVVGAGYRFIATVTEVEVAERLTSETPEESDSAAQDDLLSPPLSEDLVPQVVRRRLGRRAAVATAVACAIAAPVVFLLLQGSSRQAATQGADLHLARVTDSGDVEFADISPDGKYVAYLRQTGGARTLWLKQLTTGRVLMLAAIGSFECPGLTFSPDGNYVYFVRKRPFEPSGELDQVPLLGGNPAMVLDGISGTPAISPDGRRIAFVRSTLETHGEDSVVTASIDGSGQRVLATYEAPGIHFNRITWMADGKTLIFPLQGRLTSIPAEGGTARQLMGDAWDVVDDLWQLPQSKDLVVVGRLLDAGSVQVFEVSTSGGGIRPITHDLSNYKQVRVTADGKTLLVVQEVVLSTIQVLDPRAGPEVRSLSAGSQSHDGLGGLAWSPQGAIVYTSDSDRRRELKAVDAAGENPRVLAYSDMHSEVMTFPAVSPHGDFIVFARWLRGDIANIWRMDINGGDQTRLTSGRQDFPPSVTPDVKWVIYGSVQDKGSVLMKIPSGGGTAIKLTDFNADYPTVSPDGRWIGCFRIPTGDQSATLAIVPVAGGPAAKIFKLPETATHMPLAWAPDGRAVTFVNHVSGVDNIWSQPLDGGPATPVTQFTSDRIFSFQWSRNWQLAVSRGTEAVDAIMIGNFRENR